jgi:putative nucleotidyltransferase with HDIG domain
MIEKEEALKLLNKYLRNDKLLKHSYAVEAIMKSIANYFNEDEVLWSLIGLLHDLDYEYTQNTPEKHSKMTVNILIDLLPEKALNAIKAHNYLHTDYIPINVLDKSLLASDAVSGLIISSALVMPNKKLNEVTIETLIKKFKDKSFAKGCSREKIYLCKDIGISLEEFLSISLKALKNISSTLEL